jgi:glutaredoxin-dependent peroxiredoxin
MTAVGTVAPDFKLTTLTAEGPKYLTLSEFKGESNVLLLFVPMAFTGVCTQELCSISNGMNDYTALGCKVIGISGDNPFAQDAWAKKENITIPLASDYDHSVAKAYGIAYEAFLPEKNLGQAGVAKRSAFLVDKNGIVQYAESHDHPGTLPDFDAIKAKLATL